MAGNALVVGGRRLAPEGTTSVPSVGYHVRPGRLRSLPTEPREYIAAAPPGGAIIASTRRIGGAMSKTVPSSDAIVASISADHSWNGSSPSMPSDRSVSRWSNASLIVAAGEDAAGGDRHFHHDRNADRKMVRISPVSLP